MPGVTAFISWQYRIVGRPWPTPESRAPVVLKRLLDLHTRVHHEGSVLDDGFSNWSSLQKQELALGGSIINGNFDLCPKLGSRVERDLVFPESQCIAPEKIDVAHAASRGWRKFESRFRLHFHRPDRHIGFRPRCQGMRGRSRSAGVAH